MAKKYLIRRRKKKMHGGWLWAIPLLMPFAQQLAKKIIGDGGKTRLKKA